MPQEDSKHIPYYHTDHGAEIFPRRRTFTPEEKLWRNTAADFLWKDFIRYLSQK